MAIPKDKDELLKAIVDNLTDISHRLLKESDLFIRAPIPLNEQIVFLVIFAQ